MEATWQRRVFYREGEMRAPVKIALFFLLFLFFAIAGQYVVSVLPRHPLQWASLVAMTLAALLAGWILISHVDRRPFGALGFPATRHTPGDILRGVAGGGALIGLAVLLLLLTGSAAFTNDSGSLGGYFGFLFWTLLFFGIAAAFEEVVFRGYPFQVLVQWIGPWPAIVLSSALFAFLHAQNPNVTPLAIANIFVAGVILAIVYLRTLSLWVATAVHLGWNWTMSSLFDFPVSGLGYETPLYSAVSLGPDWWTGGLFGPEAGLAGTLCLCAAVVWLVRTRRIRPHHELAALRPLTMGGLDEVGT